MAEVLPSVLRTVELLRSDDTAEQIEGIVLASEIMKMDMDVINQVPSEERFEISTLPRRLYDRFLSDHPAVSREAAYALVACSKSFGGPLSHRARFSDLSTAERAFFVSSLPFLLSEIGLVRMINADAKILRSTEDGAEIEINVIITRRLPFDVDGAPVLLQERPLKNSNEVYIVVQSGKTISEDRVREISDQEGARGVVGKGSAVYLLKPTPIKGDLIKVVIIFDAYAEMMEFALS